MQHTKKIVLALALSASSLFAFGQGMAVNSTGSVADPSAMLDVSSTNQGVLVPRMTLTERNAIASPATGLLIYQIDGTAGFYVYDGSAWTAVSSAGASGWGLNGNSGNSLSNFFGTTDFVPIMFRTNNTRSGYINPVGGVFLGLNSGHPTSVFTKNIAIGRNALNAYTSNTYTSIAIGDSALTITTGPECIGIGEKTLLKNSSGGSNIAIGSYSLMSNTTGASNTAVGGSSLYSNTTGITNCSFGLHSLYSNRTGNGNSAFGYGALAGNTKGQYNVAFGEGSLAGNDSGSYNTAVGIQAMMGLTSGQFNVVIGYGAASALVNGSGNTAVGRGASVTASANNAGAFGATATSNANNKIVIGNTGVTVIGGSVAWSNLSDVRFKSHIQENVPGLDFIMKLRPVTYHFEARKYEQFLGIPDSINKDRGQEYWKESESMVRTGFIAQEVEQAARQAGYDFSGLHKPATDKDNYTLAYSEFTVPLVKAMQEQQKIIEQQQRMIQDLQKSQERQQKTLDVALKKLADLEQRK